MRIDCPECGLGRDFPLELVSPIEMRCPACRLRFRVYPDGRQESLGRAGISLKPPPERPSARRARPLRPLVVEATPEAPAEAQSPAAQARRRRPLVALGVLALGLALGLAALLWPEPAPPPQAPEVVAPQAPVLAPAPREDRPAELLVQVTQVDRLPERRALLVHGHVYNGGDLPVGGIRAGVTLFTEDKPRRRRSTWCCEVLSLEQAKRIAAQPSHPHFTAETPASRRAAVAPKEELEFSLIFASLPDKLLREDIRAEASLEASKLLSPRPSSGGAGARTSP